MCTTYEYALLLDLHLKRQKSLKQSQSLSHLSPTEFHSPCSHPSPLPPYQAPDNPNISEAGEARRGSGRKNMNESGPTPQLTKLKLQILFDPSLSLLTVFFKMHKTFNIY